MPSCLWMMPLDKNMKQIPICVNPVLGLARESARFDQNHRFSLITYSIFLNVDSDKNMWMARLI